MKFDVGMLNQTKVIDQIRLATMTMTFAGLAPNQIPTQKLYI